MTKDSVSPPIVVIVGLGMVAQRLCDALRERASSEQLRVVVFGEEPLLAYDRIRLGALLATPTADLALASADWYRARAIELQLGEPVVRIDRARREIHTRSGRTQAYDRLVLATGARARVPAVPGLSVRGALTYRTARDAARIHAACRGRRSVAILGGGLLGLECGDALARRGLTVTVLEAGPHLLPRQLDAASARLLARLLEQRGLRLQTGYRLLRVEPRGAAGHRLFGESAAPLDADVLVVAAGVVPESRLAAAAGIQCAPAGGIVVDDALATDDPAIFALGDCVSHRGVTPGLVAPGYRMAEVLAARLCGDADARFEGVSRNCELKIGGVPVVALGRYEPHEDSGRVYHHGERSARCLVVQGGRLVGATFVGEWDARLSVQEAVLQTRPLSEAQRARFAATGELAGAERAPVSCWPAKAMVCQCARVTRGQLGELVACGNASVSSLQQITRAGTVCGSCVPLLAELVGARGERPKLPFARAVGALSALTLACAAGHFALPPLPPSHSVQGAIFAAEQLWRSTALRQWTGFALMGLFTLGLLLSLRKRVRWFRWGNFGAFRALHTALGLASLAALYLHTGLRFGAHLNFLLMSVFVAACTLGALAGILVYFEHRRDDVRVRALRGTVARAHLWLLWPLPALLGFHIFAAYYF